MRIFERSKIILVIIIFLGIFFTTLNLPVITKQGVNYVVKEIKIPLYVKISEFVVRDYYYSKTANEIIDSRMSDKAKVIELFFWTFNNIQKDIPENWRIVDDHVWNIIIRGYGTDDQVSDVFTTLCNYVDLPAFWITQFSKEKDKKIVISFVKVSNKWKMFDPYRGIYFLNKNQEIADMHDIICNFENLTIQKIGLNFPEKSYFDCLNNLKPIKDFGMLRGRKHMPFARLVFEIKKKIISFFKKT